MPVDHNDLGREFRVEASPHTLWCELRDRTGRCSGLAPDGARRETAGWWDGTTLREAGVRRIAGRCHAPRQGHRRL